MLSGKEGQRLYRLQLTNEVPVVTYPEVVRLGGQRLKMRYENGRWHARDRFPSLATFETVHGPARGPGRRTPDCPSVPCRRERPGVRRPDRRPARDAPLAYRRGYFAALREVTAAELSISNQAVSERLHRGYARLVESQPAFDRVDADE